MGERDGTDFKRTHYRIRGFVDRGQDTVADRRRAVRSDNEVTMANYIALLREEPTSDYGVDFPDLPGCLAAGRTLEEARRMAAEALEFHVAGIEEDREALPCRRLSMP